MILMEQLLFNAYISNKPLEINSLSKEDKIKLIKLYINYIKESSIENIPYHIKFVLNGVIKPENQTNAELIDIIKHLHSLIRNNKTII